MFLGLVHHHAVVAFVACGSRFARIRCTLDLGIGKEELLVTGLVFFLLGSLCVARLLVFVLVWLLRLCFFLVAHRCIAVAAFRLALLGNGSSIRKLWPILVQHCFKSFNVCVVASDALCHGGACG